MNLAMRSHDAVERVEAHASAAWGEFPDAAVAEITELGSFDFRSR